MKAAQEKEAELNGCLPDAQQRRLLTLCLAPAEDEARQAWTAWIAAANLETLDKASERLLPLAYHRLAALGVQHREMARLGGVLRHAWVNNLTVRRRLEPVLAEFDARGIRHVLLKGCPLAFDVYPNPGARQMDDVDVLVPLEQAWAAMEALEGPGVELLENPLPAGARADGTAALRFKHGLSYRLRSGLAIDLHWFALADCCQPGIDDGFWARRRPLPALGRAWALAPEDNLLQLCAHGLRANPIASIRWIADAVLLLRAAGPGFDWEALRAEARRRRLIVPLREALGYVQRTFGAPVPAEALARMAAEPTSWLERAAHRGNVSGRFALQFAATWLRYERMTPEAGWWRRGMGFPDFLRQSWGRIGYRDVLGHIVRRSLGRGRA